MTNAIAVALRIIPPVVRNLVRIKLTWIGFDSLIVDIECGNYELACIIDRFTFDAGVIFDDAGTIFVVLQRVGDQHDPENVSVDDLSIDWRERRKYTNPFIAIETHNMGKEELGPCM